MMNDRNSIYFLIYGHIEHYEKINFKLTLKIKYWSPTLEKRNLNIFTKQDLLENQNTKEIFNNFRVMILTSKDKDY